MNIPANICQKTPVFVTYQVDTICWKSATVTLILTSGCLFFYLTHPLHMMNISESLFQNPPMCDLLRGQQSGHTDKLVEQLIYAHLHGHKNTKTSQTHSQSFLFLTS